MEIVYTTMYSYEKINKKKNNFVNISNKILIVMTIIYCKIKIKTNDK